MNEDNNRQLTARQIAHHESGHCAMALYHRVAFKDVNIIAEAAEDGELWGWEGRMSYESVGGIGGHRTDRQVTGTKVVEGKVYELTENIPLTDRQKSENIIDCKITLGGPLAEQVILGIDTDWQTVWRDIKGTDINYIETDLMNNLTTKNTRPTKAEIAHALEELIAETLPLFIDGNGTVTPLWKQCCRISDALYSRRELTFAQCWQLYDGEELPPKSIGFGVYQK